MTYSHDPDETRVIPPVTGQPGNGWTAEERAARAAGQKGHLRNWLATGDKTLDPDSAKAGSSRRSSTTGWRSPASSWCSSAGPLP